MDQRKGKQDTIIWDSPSPGWDPLGCKLTSAGKQQEPQGPGLLKQDWMKKQHMCSKEESQSRQGTSVLKDVSRTYFVIVLEGIVVHLETVGTIVKVRQ